MIGIQYDIQIVYVHYLYLGDNAWDIAARNNVYKLLNPLVSYCTTIKILFLVLWLKARSVLKQKYV